MKNKKLILKSYLLGFMTAGYIYLLLSFYDFIISDYVKQPTFKNIMYSCLSSGLGFAICFFIYIKYLKNKQ